MSAAYLRVAAPASTRSIPVDEAIERAQHEFLKARNAYIDLLQTFGGYRLHAMIRSDEKLTVPRLRSTRDEAQRMAELALAVVSALDACIDTCERAARPKAADR